MTVTAARRVGLVLEAKSVPADRVIIVGAGIGGLSAAVSLAARGLQVTVLERAHAPGGKLRELNVGGHAVDSGPTVFTMRWVFDEIFEAAGAHLDDHLSLIRLDTLARHYWGDGSGLDLFTDTQRSADAIGHFAGPAEARGYLRFAARAEQIYSLLDAPFIRQEPPGMLSLVRGIGLKQLPGFTSISPFTTLWRELGRYFRDPRLQQLFGRYATYCGASPFQAPATLMLISHVERLGVWSVAGGMHALPRAFASLATRLGGQMRFDTEVRCITTANGRASGVVLASGEHISADAVLLNADVGSLAVGHFGSDVKAAAAPVPPRKRSLSAMTWSMVAEAKGVPLDRHTVFFSDNYAAEFKAIQSGRLAAKPTVYVCAQDRGGHGDLATEHAVPQQAERLFLIVNAPATGDAQSSTAAENEQCTKATFQTLATCGLKLARQPGLTKMTTPADFNQLFPATGGALYGMASHGWQAAFRRPGARSRIPGLYLAGGSVHPGPGIPMAALSGRMAASRIILDLASMRRLRPAAMLGGTSTPLVTTVSTG